MITVSRAQPKAGTKATIKAIEELSPRLREILDSFPEEYKFGKIGGGWYLFAGCNPNDPSAGYSEGAWDSLEEAIECVHEDTV